MSAPPLPDVFGNYVLGNFVEVIPPGPIDWFPQTAGWQIVAIVAVAAALRSGLRYARHWYQNRYRSEAAERLKIIGTNTNCDTFLKELNQLLKLTALVAYHRETVAKLSGTPWVDFLNDQCTVPVFCGDQIALLATGSYRHIEIEKQEVEDLLKASARWIAEHRGLQHV